MGCVVEWLENPTAVTGLWSYDSREFVPDYVSVLRALLGGEAVSKSGCKMKKTL